MKSPSNCSIITLRNKRRGGFKMTETFHSGFIAIIGRPNVGKSTFMNRVLGQKVAITSDKPQTTRNKIQGVYTTKDFQMVFIDTPGIHKPKHKLGTFMVQTSENTLNEVDAIIFMVNAHEGLGRGDQFIIDMLKNVRRPVYLVINKVDLIEKDAIFPIIESYQSLYDFTEIVPISAVEGYNVEHLLTLLENELEEGPQFYPDEFVTDHPERFIMGELIREKVLRLTKEEIPHSVAVNIEHIERRNNGSVFIQASIITERDSQKGILIGKKGSMLKAIGKEARKDIEHILGSHVYLELRIKVKPGWRNNQRQLHELGFQRDEY